MPVLPIDHSRQGCPLCSLHGGSKSSIDNHNIGGKK
jgi:hypothetical protein